MRTRWIVGCVVGAHVVALAILVLAQGCGTTQVQGPPTTQTVKMPPVVGMEQDVKPSPVPQIVKPEVKSWPAGTTTYIVRKGDSLSKIASRYDVSPAAVIALNHLKHPDKIFVGQRLLLPGAVDVDAPPPKSAAKTAAKPKVTVSGDAYVVKSGDTLSGIAVAMGTTVSELKAANGLKSDRIYAGQKLAAPSGAKPQVAASVPVPQKPAPKPAPRPEPVVVTSPVTEIQSAPIEPAPEVRPESAAVVAPSAPMSLHPHKVEEGEDLYSVALMWDVDIEELKRVNNLMSTDLVPGQVLQVPLSE